MEQARQHEKDLDDLGQEMYNYLIYGMSESSLDINVWNHIDGRMDILWDGLRMHDASWLVETRI